MSPLWSILGKGCIRGKYCYSFTCPPFPGTVLLAPACSVTAGVGSYFNFCCSGAQGNSSRCWWGRSIHLSSKCFSPSTLCLCTLSPGCPGQGNSLCCPALTSWHNRCWATLKSGLHGSELSLWSCATPALVRDRGCSPPGSGDSQGWGA